MTYQHYAPYQPPPPRRRTPTALIIAVGGLALLLFAGVVIVAANTGTGTAGGATPSQSTSATSATSETNPPSYTPTVADFTLKPKITRRECFGSAGCNVTFRVDLSYSGMPLDPDTSYDVTYKVTGPEDGPAINTLTVQGDQYSSEEDTVSTRSSHTKLHVVVTDVTAE